jgi:5'-3' exonuclease
MFNNIFEYTDKLIKIIRPKKVIYFAVDGVAPRAKMNQQRSRRFRAAFEARDKKEKEKHLLKEWMDKGIKLPETEEHHFDSNVITPGTEFMYNLTEALQVIF